MKYVGYKVGGEVCELRSQECLKEKPSLFYTSCK